MRANGIGPDDFPEDCPPEQALPANGAYYRIVKGNPPTSHDFDSAYHQNPSRAEREIERGRRTRCETMGLSVFSDQRHAIQCASQYPRIGTMISLVTLTNEAGKVLRTGGQFDSHHTWWKSLDFDPITVAQVVHRL